MHNAKHIKFIYDVYFLTHNSIESVISNLKIKHSLWQALQVTYALL